MDPSPHITRSTSELMPASQSELCRETGTLYGTANLAVVAAPVPLVVLRYGFLYDHGHADEYITPMTEHHTAPTEAAQSAEARPHITTTHSCLHPLSDVSICKMGFRFVYAS